MLLEVHVFVGAPTITQRIQDLTFLPYALKAALPSTRNVFYDRLTEATYDVDALCTACGLNNENSQSRTTYDNIYNHFVDFFNSCLEPNFGEANLLDFMQQTSLFAVTDRFMAPAIQRLSSAHGLPHDGHALHAVIQAKTSFLHFGPNRNIRVESIRGTESGWELPSHRASVFVIGESAAGKDTMIKILRILDDKLAKAIGKGKPCLNILKVGHPTYNGLISALKTGNTKSGTSVLVWYNSEIKACIQNTERAIKEEHLCQLAEGTEVGKRTEDKEICIVPNCWFVIGAQPDALYERVGGSDNGRLRAFCAFLDRRQCCKVIFLEKFLKRDACLKHVSVLCQYFTIMQHIAFAIPSCAKIYIYIFFLGGRGKHGTNRLMV